MMKQVLFVLFFGALALPAADKFSNRRAPGFNLPDQSFRRYDLQDYRGRWLLIDFTQTACPYCKELAKSLEKVRLAYGEKIAILQVALPPDNFGTVAKYIQEQSITVPVVFDMGQMAGSYFEATPQRPSFDTPHLFIINPEGRIVRDFGHEDQAQLTPAALIGILDALTKGSRK